MRTHTLTLALLAALTLSAPAYAATAPERPSDGAKVRWYIFDHGLDVLGTVKGPAATVVGSDRRARFAPLRQLKKSFVPALLRTAKSRTFK